MNIQMRKYPFPFKAALSINNDTDGMDWAAFEDWHSFVCGTDETIYGTGLGLEISDSFWIWSEKNCFSLFHSAPWEKTYQNSPEQSRIIELVQGGWIDTLHSFGDWNSDYQINRSHMEFAAETLDKFNLSPPLYVNHGEGLRFHNIAGPWPTYQSGDAPDSPYYNLDILLKAGFRFFWVDSLFENLRFGENMQFSPKSPEVKNYKYRRWLYTNEKSIDNKLKLKHDLFSNLSKKERLEIAHYCSNNQLLPLVGRDGSKFIGFKRFRGQHGPTSANFALQVKSDNLDQLEKHEGVAIVYQHIGVWRAIGMSKRHPSQTEYKMPVLDENAAWAFRELQKRQNDGKIFITTTSRLLKYLYVRDSLDYEILENDVCVEILIKNIECPVYGTQELSEQDLQGITFLVDSNCVSVNIRLKGNNLSLAYERKADPSNPGKDALYLKWNRMTFPTLNSKPIKRANSQAKPVEKNGLDPQTFFSLLDDKKNIDFLKLVRKFAKKNWAFETNFAATENGKKKSSHHPFILIKNYAKKFLNAIK